MAIVWIPPPLRHLTAGQATVTAEGETVGQVLAAVDARYPGLKDSLCQGDELRSGLIVGVDTEVATLGLLHPVRPDSEVHFLPALGGG